VLCVGRINLLIAPKGIEISRLKPLP